MISFIVPAYNAAKTIKRTIDSILKQAESKIDYEIIIVDDGSTDDLRSVINQYSISDLQKIKYLKKENGGLSDARNYGLKKAEGDYIIFVDADDYINKRLLKDIEKYINKNIDLIKWKPVRIDENGKEIKIKKEELQEENIEVISGEEGFNKLYGTDPMLVCSWNYCIKKSLIHEFPVGKYHEDFATTPINMLNANTMVITEKYEYYYVQTENSIMRGNDEAKQKKRLKDMLEHFDNLLKTTSKMQISRITKENVAIFGVNALLANIPELTLENKKYFKEELKKREIYKYIKPRNFKQKVKRVLLKIKF